MNNRNYESKVNNLSPIYIYFKRLLKFTLKAKNKKIINDNKKYELIQEENDSIVIRVYENIENSEASIVASLPTYWGSWSTMISLSNCFVGNTVNTGLALSLGHVLSIFSVVPSGVLESLLEGASWTELGSRPGDEVADFWDTNNDGSVSFQKRSKADTWGNIEMTEWREQYDV